MNENKKGSEPDRNGEEGWCAFPLRWGREAIYMVGHVMGWGATPTLPLKPAQKVTVTVYVHIICLNALSMGVNIIPVASQSRGYQHG
jgi:hypothetical protein